MLAGHNFLMLVLSAALRHGARAIRSTRNQLRSLHSSRAPRLPVTSRRSLCLEHRAVVVSPRHARLLAIFSGPVEEDGTKPFFDMISFAKKESEATSRLSRISTVDDFLEAMMQGRLQDDYYHTFKCLSMLLFGAHHVSKEVGARLPTPEQIEQCEGVVSDKRFIAFLAQLSERRANDMIGPPDMATVLQVLVKILVSTRSPPHELKACVAELLQALVARPEELCEHSLRVVLWSLVKLQPVQPMPDSVWMTVLNACTTPLLASLKATSAGVIMWALATAPPIVPRSRIHDVSLRLIDNLDVSSLPTYTITNLLLSLTIMVHPVRRLFTPVLTQLALRVDELEGSQIASIFMTCARIQFYHHGMIRSFNASLLSLIHI